MTNQTSRSTNYSLQEIATLYLKDDPVWVANSIYYTIKSTSEKVEFMRVPDKHIFLPHLGDVPINYGWVLRFLCDTSKQKALTYGLDPKGAVFETSLQIKEIIYQLFGKVNIKRNQSWITDDRLFQAWPATNKTPWQVKPSFESPNQYYGLREVLGAHVGYGKTRNQAYDDLQLSLKRAYHTRSQKQSLIKGSTKLKG